MVTEKYAEELGYDYTGIYTRNKEEAKTRALALRKQGNKAMVVTEPDNPLSRGPKGVGYSVYWVESEKNRKARLATEQSNLLSRLLRERIALEEQIKEVDRRIEEVRNREVE